MSFSIAIGSDHAGFNYKQAIIGHLKSRGYAIQDFGTDSTESCDYPQFVRPAAEAVARGDNDANCLAIGERTVSLEAALRIVDLFLATDFDRGRHKRRVDQIEPA